MCFYSKHLVVNAFSFVVLKYSNIYFSYVFHFQNISQVTKLVQRISELEHEVAGCHGTIASLQEQQSSVNKVIEEHVAEKKKVLKAFCYV